MSAVKVTIVNYTDYLRIDVDRIDCGSIGTHLTGMLAARELESLLKKIFNAIAIENIEVIVK